MTKNTVKNAKPSKSRKNKKSRKIPLARLEALVLEVFDRSDEVEPDYNELLRKAA